MGAGCSRMALRLRPTHPKYLELRTQSRHLRLVRVAIPPGGASDSIGWVQGLCRMRSTPCSRWPSLASIKPRVGDGFSSLATPRLRPDTGPRSLAISNPRRTIMAIQIVMNPTGDSRHSFNPNDAQELAKAEQRFYEL